MTDFTLDFRKTPYSMSAEEKDRVLTQQLSFLTEFHRESAPSMGEF